VTRRWTPGPWSLTTSEPPGQWVMSSDTAMGPGRLQRQDVGRFMGGSTTPPETAEANARLIAAAPELYDALVAAVALLRAFVHEDTDRLAAAVLSGARAALVKAEGSG
jgi:hypothetical protein